MRLTTRAHGLFIMTTLVALSVAPATACGESSMAPGAPPDNSQAMKVIPALTGLRMTESQRFSAVTTAGGNQVAISDVTWSSNHPDVCSVSSDGSVIALRLGDASITATSSGRTASVDLRVVPDVGGTWTGRAFVSVTRISGLGRYDIPADGFFPYEVRLRQEHDRLNGTDRMTSFAGTLQGTVDQAGRITLQGTFTGGPEAGTIETNPWNGEVDASGHLEGGFVAVHRFTNIYGPQVVQYRYTDIDVTRQ
jgi:Bacterial Ig-like domain (group 2)